MYHASRFSRESWVGEPEIDPTQELEEREHIEGRELTPLDCLRRSYPAVVKEESVEAGTIVSVVALSEANATRQARVLLVFSVSITRRAY